MSQPDADWTAWGTPPSPRYEALAARFRPVFARLRAGAVAREQSRDLPHEAIGWLKEARFGALRVPEAEGGFGASLPDLFGLLAELAEADSNLPQALRNHLASPRTPSAARRARAGRTGSNASRPATCSAARGPRPARPRSAPSRPASTAAARAGA